MKQLHLQNKQRDRVLNTKELRQAARLLLDELLRIQSFDLAIHFITATEMARINKAFLDHEGSTDVITFDYSSGYDERESSGQELSGEIFISVADAVAQAKTFKRPWEEEIVRYLVHGVLHLRGYDDLQAADRRKMKALESRLLRQILATLELNGRTG
jgi:probable rRNA maturation factor